MARQDLSTRDSLSHDFLCGESSQVRSRHRLANHLAAIQCLWFVLETEADGQQLSPESLQRLEELENLLVESTGLLQHMRREFQEQKMA